jgi:hypothetical protein
MTFRVITNRIVDSRFQRLVGYWMLDQSSGTNVEDAAGSYDGTIRNGTALHPDPDPMWVDGNPTLPVELSSFTAILTADFFVRFTLDYPVRKPASADFTSIVQV